MKYFRLFIITMLLGLMASTSYAGNGWVKQIDKSTPTKLFKDEGILFTGANGEDWCWIKVSAGRAFGKGEVWCTATSYLSGWAKEQNAVLVSGPSLPIIQAFRPAKAEFENNLKAGKELWLLSWISCPTSTGGN